MKVKIIITVTIMLWPCAMLRAGFSDDYIGTTGGQFLQIAKGVRQAGMGGAYCAVRGDMNSVYSNPAGLESLKEIEISAMHSVWFEEIFYNNFSVGMPTDIGVMALSVNYLGMSEIAKYNIYRQKLDEGYRPHDILGYLSYANRIDENIFGINIFMLQSVIEDESASSFGIDLGYISKINEQIDAGISVQNIGTKMKFMNEADPLPLNIKTGMSYRPIDSLTVAADLNFSRSSEPDLNIGGEYKYGIDDLDFKARAGYNTMPVRSNGGLSGISLGGGIRYSSLFFDYAWAPYGDLGGTHRFSFSYRFSKEKEDKDEKEETPAEDEKAEPETPDFEYILSYEEPEEKEKDPDKKEEEKSLDLEKEARAFAFDSYKVTEAHMEIIEEVAELLKKYPDLKVSIEGHTDNIGDKEYNMELSKLRAGAVAEELEKLDISGERMVIKGHGEEKPAADNDTSEGRALNRRVEIRSITERDKEKEIEDEN